MEAIFGVKMEKYNSLEVEKMHIGGIVFNVWKGLFINKMVTQ